MSIRPRPDAGDKTARKYSHGDYVGAGIALGVAFGAAFDQVGLGIAIGIAVGAALNAVASKRAKSHDRDGH